MYAYKIFMQIGLHLLYSLSYLIKREKRKETEEHRLPSMLPIKLFLPIKPFLPGGASLRCFH